MGTRLRIVPITGPNIDPAPPCLLHYRPPHVTQCKTQGIHMVRSIIIDTDPGQDDAVALLLAFASPELNVLGVTTVAGNVPLSLTSKNALKICELARRTDVPVHAGCDRPMDRPLVTAEHVHGKTGLDGSNLPDPSTALAQKHAVDFIIDQVRSNPDKSITLCPLGPLTNIATALTQAPDIAPKIQEIVLMGGGYFEGGNITPVAEFNIYVDPKSADIVLRSGIDITMLPLDATHQAMIRQDWLDHLAAWKTPVGTAVSGMLDFSQRFDVEKYEGKGAPLHDPTVIAYLLDPTLFSGRLINVEIETQSELTLGMTVADWWRVTNRPANVTFIRDINEAAFFDLLTQRLATL